MIRLEEISKSYDWESKFLLATGGKTRKYETAKNKALEEDEQSRRVSIEVVAGVVLRISAPELMIEDLHELYSPLIANIRAQSDLVTSVEALAYVFTDNGCRASVNTIVVRERFGKTYGDSIEESNINNANRMKVSDLEHFLNRLVKMLELRELIAPDITTKAIHFDVNSGFELNTALFNHNDQTTIKGSYSTCAKPILGLSTSEAMKHNTPAEWQLSEQYNRGLETNMFAAWANSIDQDSLSKGEFRGETRSSKATIDLLLQRYSSIGTNPRAFVTAVCKSLNVLTRIAGFPCKGSDFGWTHSAAIGIAFCEGDYHGAPPLQAPAVAC